jgi:hypothetical protein
VWGDDLREARMASLIEELREKLWAIAYEAMHSFVC